MERNKNYNLILTSRNKELGKESYNRLLNEFKEYSNNLFYHQLDITNPNSRRECIPWIKEKFDQIDILVNNAAVYKRDRNLDADLFEFTFNPNVYGTINITEEFIQKDIIRKNGKIIMISSAVGNVSKLDENLKKKFGDENLTTEKLFKLVEYFRESIVNKKIIENGWADSTHQSLYRVSKMIINIYPRVLAKRKEIQERNIGVYSLHPGWVKTDMGGLNAPMSLEEGVVNPIYVIDLPDGIIPELQGQYFENCKVGSFGL
jgi:carbonyl reductase 1